MATMYTHDKLFRITLRVNENQFSFVKSTADTLGISPAEFLRMIINATMVQSNKAVASFERHNSNNIMGVSGRENDENTFNDKL